MSCACQAGEALGAIGSAEVLDILREYTNDPQTEVHVHVVLHTTSTKIWWWPESTVSNSYACVVLEIHANAFWKLKCFESDALIGTKWSIFGSHED